MGKKVVTLGEIMLRLSTPGNTRFVQSDRKSTRLNSSH